MKITITFKDPDALQDAVHEALEDHLKESKELADEEREELLESRTEKTTEEITGKWIEYGEYLTVEYDTEEKTMKVIPFS